MGRHFALAQTTVGLSGKKTELCRFQNPHGHDGNYADDSAAESVKERGEKL
jgi:hypothetical protein